jgi:hypothetical protein
MYRQFEKKKKKNSPQLTKFSPKKTLNFQPEHLQWVHTEAQINPKWQSTHIISARVNYNSALISPVWIGFLDSQVAQPPPLRPPPPQIAPNLGPPKKCNLDFLKFKPPLLTKSARLHIFLVKLELGFGAPETGARGGGTCLRCKALARTVRNRRVVTRGTHEEDARVGSSGCW